MPINLFGGESVDNSTESLGGGRLHAGMQDDAGLPMSVDTWLFSSDDPDTIEALAERFGGDVEEYEKGDDTRFRVLTDAEEIPVVISKGGLFSSLILWGPNNDKVVETDGTHIIDEDGMLTDDLCPYTQGKSLKEILAMKFRPNLRAYFHIADAPELGSFVFFSQSKTALAHWAEREAELADLDEEEVTTTLTLEFVESRRGGFRKPQIGQMAHSDSAPSVRSSKQTAKKAAKPAKKTTKKATKRATARK